MFPSSSSSYGGVDPFSYPDLYPNSTPKQQQQLVPPLSSHYPFAFLDNEFFLDHFISPSQSLLLPSDTPSTAVHIPSNDKQTTKQRVMKSNDVELDKETLGKGNGSGNGPKKGNPKRRGSKTDRHSKICTRHGPRDRRMRLSLKIARRFFDLQDLLGFDKASKTIDWLFNHSKAAIKEVAGKFDTTLDLGPGKNSVISSSNRKAALESSREAATYNANFEQKNVYGRSNELLMLVNNSSDASNKTSDELGFQLQHTAKDLRTQARARARERTRKRKLIRSLEKSEQDNLGKTNPSCSVHVGPAVVEDTRGTSCSKTSNEIMGKTSKSGSRAMLNNSLEFTACSRGLQPGNINLFEYFGDWNNVDVTRIYSNDGAMICSGSFTGNATESPSSYLHPHSSLPHSFQGN